MEGCNPFSKVAAAVGRLASYDGGGRAEGLPSKKEQKKKEKISDRLSKRRGGIWRAESK